MESAPHGWGVMEWSSCGDSLSKSLPISGILRADQKVARSVIVWGRLHVISAARF